MAEKHRSESRAEARVRGITEDDERKDRSGDRSNAEKRASSRCPKLPQGTNSAVLSPQLSASTPRAFTMSTAPGNGRSNKDHRETARRESLDQDDSPGIAQRNSLGEVVVEPPQNGKDRSVRRVRLTCSRRTSEAISPVATISKLRRSGAVAAGVRWSPNNRRLGPKSAPAGIEATSRGRSARSR